jgi:hypothetical protein
LESWGNHHLKRARMSLAQGVDGARQTTKWPSNTPEAQDSARGPGMQTSDLFVWS